MASEPQIIQLPKIVDHRGNLSFIQNGAHIPFDIARCYWIYDVPGGEERHGHAFRNASELIVALSGSFDVVTFDGATEHRYHLCRSFYGLLVPRMTWRALDNFSTNSVAMVLSSTSYDPHDYIYTLEDYNKALSAEGRSGASDAEGRSGASCVEGLSEASDADNCSGC